MRCMLCCAPRATTCGGCCVRLFAWVWGPSFLSLPRCIGSSMCHRIRCLRTGNASGGLTFPLRQNAPSASCIKQTEFCRSDYVPACDRRTHPLHRDLSPLVFVPSFFMEISHQIR